MQDSFFALFAFSHKTNQNRTAGHFIGNFFVSRTHVKEFGVMDWSRLTTCVLRDV